MALFGIETFDPEKHEVRLCACGCGDRFLASKRSTQTFKNRKHQRTVRTVTVSINLKEEVRVCLCGCNLSFAAYVDAQPLFFSKQHANRASAYRIKLSSAGISPGVRNAKR